MDKKIPSTQRWKVEEDFFLFSVSSSNELTNLSYFLQIQPTLPKLVNRVSFWNGIKYCLVGQAVLYCVVFPNELGTVYKCSKALKFLLWKLEAPTLWEQTGEMSKYSHPHRSWLQYPRLLRGGWRGLTEFHPFLNSNPRVI